MWVLIMILLVRETPPVEYEYFPTEAQCVVRLRDWSAAAIDWQRKAGGIGGGSFAGCQRAQVRI
jgi:hypothetical protein